MTPDNNIRDPHPNCSWSSATSSSCPDFHMTSCLHEPLMEISDTNQKSHSLYGYRLLWRRFKVKLCFEGNVQHVYTFQNIEFYTYGYHCMQISLWKKIIFNILEENSSKYTITCLLICISNYPIDPSSMYTDRHFECCFCLL